MDVEAEGGGLAHRDREGDGIGESNAERPGVSRIVLLHGGMEGSQSSEGKDTRKGRLYERKQKIGLGRSGDSRRGGDKTTPQSRHGSLEPNSERTGQGMPCPPILIRSRKGRVNGFKRYPRRPVGARWGRSPRSAVGAHYGGTGAGVDR